MSSPDTSEIRRVLQVFDQSSNSPTRQAVGMLQGITKQIAKSPAAYDLLEEPADAQAWSTAGGESYCENQEFGNVLAARWLELLSKPDFAKAGYDKDELIGLKGDFQGWFRAFARVELEFGDKEELLSKLDELIAAAPEAESDDDSSDEEST